jgi:hypothetical protein
MQEITNINGQYTITVTDDQYPNYKVSKNISHTSLELYLEMYRTLHERLNKHLVFYVNPSLIVKEWGLGFRGLNLMTNHDAGKSLLWITPYYMNSDFNFICFPYTHFEKLKNSPHYKSNIPNNYGHRIGLCHFAGYKVFEKEYTQTGKWIFIYIDSMNNFDKVVELIKDIGVWN